MNNYTHVCETCSKKNDWPELVILSDDDVSTAGGYVFCDTCGSVLFPLNGEKYQTFVGEVDAYLQKWTGKSLSKLDRDVPIGAEEKTTSLRFAISILDELRKDGTLQKIAILTRVYQDNETVWDFKDGTLRYVPAKNEWSRHIDYKLVDSDLI